MGLKEKTGELVAVEQSFCLNCLGSREREDGVYGAMFHEGLQKRVRQRCVERTLMSGLDKSIEALLKGRYIGHMEKQDMGFAKRSQQTRGYGSWAAVFVLEVQKAFEKFPCCKLRGDYSQSPMCIVSCLKGRQERE